MIINNKLFSKYKTQNIFVRFSIETTERKKKKIKANDTLVSKHTQQINNSCERFHNQNK